MPALQVNLSGIFRHAEQLHTVVVCCHAMNSNNVYHVIVKHDLVLSLSKETFHTFSLYGHEMRGQTCICRTSASTSCDVNLPWWSNDWHCWYNSLISIESRLNITLKQLKLMKSLKGPLPLPTPENAFATLGIWMHWQNHLEDTEYRRYLLAPLKTMAGLLCSQKKTLNLYLHESSQEGYHPAEQGFDQPSHLLLQRDAWYL